MPSPENPVSDWSDYYAATLEKPLHPMYDQLDRWAPRTGRALELGCGVGHGVLWWLERGLEVDAVDAESEALELLRQRLSTGAPVNLRRSTFQDLTLPGSTYDAIVAGFSLFFLPPEDFRTFWPRMLASLKPGGIFMGQLLGVNDDWKDRGFTLHDRVAVERDLENLETLYFEEAERDGETAVGTSKHWHVFHIVARKN